MKTVSIAQALCQPQARPDEKKALLYESSAFLYETPPMGSDVFDVSSTLGKLKTSKLRVV